MNYTGKQIFKVSYSWMDWEMKVEINFDFPNIMNNLKEMILFWSGGEERLNLNDGDIVETFLQQLGQKIYFMINDCGSLYSLINDFDWNNQFNGGGQEGYCPMDGSKGIKIIEAETWGVDCDEFEVEIDKPKIEMSCGNCKNSYQDFEHFSSEVCFCKLKIDECYHKNKWELKEIN